MIDYERAKREGPKLKATLTRANKIAEPKARYTAVLAACRTATRAWELWGAWPDAWSMWQRSLDDAYFAYSRSLTYLAMLESTNRCPRLEEL